MRYFDHLKDRGVQNGDHHYQSISMVMFYCLLFKFPTLTVCNQNMFTLTYVEARQAAMGSDALSEILLDLFDPLSELPPPPEKLVTMVPIDRSL